MERVLRIFVSCFLSLLIIAQVALAEEVKKKEKEAELEEIVVTATKYETSIKDIPGSVTVITSEEIKNQHLPNGDIGDVLRSIPGITLRRAYAPFPAYPNIRGVGSDATVILVNGIPTNWEITQAIPPENIERIEIVRGPASALYGANASGGVINIITKEGKDEVKSTVSGGYGTFDTHRFNATTSGGVDKKFYYSLAVTQEESDGENVVTNNVLPAIKMIDKCEYDKWGASINTNYKLSDNSKLSFLYNFFNDEYTRGRPNVGGDWDRHFASFIYDQKLGESFVFKGSLGYRYDDLLHRYDYGGTKYAERQRRYTDYYEIPVELQLTGDVGLRNTLTAGFFYNRQETDQDFISSTTGALTQQNKYKVRTLAGYLQDVWKPTESLIITAGIRYDEWKNYDNTFTNFKDKYPGDSTHDNWNPKIGLRYNFTDETSIWTNYGVGYRPPAPDQLYDDRTMGGNPKRANPDLKPEKTHSWELGLEKWFGKSVQARLVGFYNYTDDKILSWFGADNVWMSKNLGRTESYGTEFEIVLHPIDHWLVTANYTWNNAKIDENPSKPAQEGNWLPFSPEHKANLGVTYAIENNFTISGVARYLSLQHTNDDNTKYTAAGEERFMDSSFVVDLKAIKHLPVRWGYLRNIDLSLSVDNVFDEKYRTFFVYEDPGRVFFGEVKFSF